MELVEDFLLTVGTRYSVHLALDLVCGLVADLEESLNPAHSAMNNGEPPGPCSAVCQ